jgi:hypothetical protein
MALVFGQGGPAQGHSDQASSSARKRGKKMAKEKKQTPVDDAEPPQGQIEDDISIASLSKCKINRFTLAFRYLLLKLQFDILI